MFDAYPVIKCSTITLADRFKQKTALTTTRNYSALMNRLYVSDSASGLEVAACSALMNRLYMSDSASVPEVAACSEHRFTAYVDLIRLQRTQCKDDKYSVCSLIIIIMYIYHAPINALSAHMIHINLNMIFYTHVENSPTKTIYIK